MIEYPLPLFLRSWFRDLAEAALIFVFVHSVYSHFVARNQVLIFLSTWDRTGLIDKTSSFLFWAIPRMTLNTDSWRDMFALGWTAEGWPWADNLLPTSWRLGLHEIPQAADISNLHLVYSVACDTGTLCSRKCDPRNGSFLSGLSCVYSPLRVNEWGIVFSFVGGAWQGSAHP